MKIALAQLRSQKGDLDINLARHQDVIERAAAQSADLIVFPELSLTNYEPTIAEAVATPPDDPRLDMFQHFADAHHMTIGIGLPTRHEAGIQISLLLFQPHQALRRYAKQYLHADEEPFFVPGPGFPSLTLGNTSIALAICYEISVPAHTEVAVQSGAPFYLASVAKFVGGIDKALTQMADIARQHGLTTLMVNSVGEADGGICAGNSSVWNAKGEVLGQLDGTQEGLLLFDTETGEVS
ncbi:Predicted amidohydrolase [Catalinimonas alkaloidigena]|uniref:Predicted amidohydrolase n=1 Tax=Catalinimonas alkaloidigena TaxID=1075417 RepID=A0A1G9RLX1_9BACT|nr:carbon-nitrogen hydrolase family protein [Catalinimonas alkaloidigena]SDM24214.1 Predicted amidohydrolase [Catalinimonas alkaloidigena]